MKKAIKTIRQALVDMPTIDLRYETDPAKIKLAAICLGIAIPVDLSQEGSVVLKIDNQSGIVHVFKRTSKEEFFHVTFRTAPFDKADLLKKFTTAVLESLGVNRNAKPKVSQTAMS